MITDNLKEREIALQTLNICGAVSCKEAAIILGICEAALQKATRDGKIDVNKPSIYGNETSKLAYYSKEAITAFMLGYEKVPELAPIKRTRIEYGKLKQGESR